MFNRTLLLRGIPLRRDGRDPDTAQEACRPLLLFLESWTREVAECARSPPGSSLHLWITGRRPKHVTVLMLFSVGLRVKSGTEI